MSETLNFQEPLNVVYLFLLAILAKMDYICDFLLASLDNINLSK